MALTGGWRDTLRDDQAPKFPVDTGVDFQATASRGGHAARHRHRMYVATTSLPLNVQHVQGSGFREGHSHHSRARPSSCQFLRKPVSHVSHSLVRPPSPHLPLQMAADTNTLRTRQWACHRCMSLLVGRTSVRMSATRMTRPTASPKSCQRLGQVSFHPRSSVLKASSSNTFGPGRHGMRLRSGPRPRTMVVSLSILSKILRLADHQDASTDGKGSASGRFGTPVVFAASCKRRGTVACTQMLMMLV